MNASIIRRKYPRTMHFPWSPGMTNDDKKIKNLNYFEGKRVILTEKMDGENTTMYSDYIHARSLDSVNHPSRDWVKQLWAEKVAYQIPDGDRICGENVYAMHSIFYTELKSYFYMFSYWDANDICVSWDDTIENAELLGLTVVPVLYDGIFDEEIIKTLCEKAANDGKEGCVLRVADAFVGEDFDKAVAKYVRANHVQTSSHWMHQSVSVNLLEG